MVKRKYFEFNEGIHGDLSADYKWFVRFNIEGVKIPPYYCDGEIADVINNALDGFGNAGIEVIDNEWSKYSVDIPSQFNVIKQRDKVTTTEKYQDVREDLAGYKRNGLWLLRRYFDPKSLTYVHWSPQDEYITFNFRKEPCQLQWNGSTFKSHSGSLGSNGTTVNLGASLPYDYRKNTVVPLINELRSKGNNGEYEDIAEELMRLCGVNFTEVSDVRFNLQNSPKKRAICKLKSA